MPNDNTAIHFRIDRELDADIDAWRRTRPEKIPAKSDAVRHLIRKGLDADSARTKQATA
jgi:hypothetical protein